MSVRDDGWKRCPDCAELVRAQARKCRFCGWRFDGASPAANGVLGMFRPHAQELSLQALLEEWGTSLNSDEEVAFFLSASTKSGHGFLLVTDLRVCFFASPKRGLLFRSGTPAALLFDQHVGMLGEVCTAGPRLRQILRIAGGGEEIVITGIVPRSKLRDVALYLQARQTGASSEQLI